jgi:hypothetical protein
MKTPGMRGFSNLSEAHSGTQAHKPRILIFSQRNIFNYALFRCAHYEFEDVICQIDSVDLLAPPVDWRKLRYAIAKRVAFHLPVALNPGVQKIRPNAEYDLFLAVCGLPTDLLAVNACSDWEKSCKTSVCLIDEFWVKQIVANSYYVHMLNKFDFVMLYYSQSVKPLGERLRSKCVFLPPGLDTLRFCPYPNPPQRVVDVYSVGRRSDITHQRLLKMAADDGLFYLHDTFRGDQAISSAGHRALFANVAKRSRYFIVNPGLIDRPDIRGNQIEIGNRYFEGAASGAIMVGERPDNGQFETLFDWPDALIHLPYDSSDIDVIIEDLDRQPERQDNIRRTNVAQALARHDWAYRWEAILKTVGLQPMPELLQRKERLRKLADIVLQSEGTHEPGSNQSAKIGVRATV